MAEHTFLAHDPSDIARILHNQNRDFEEQETQRAASKLSLQYINLHNFPIDLGVLGLFSAAEAAEAEAVPFFRDGKDVRVAVINPENPALRALLQRLSVKYHTKLYMMSQSSLATSLKLYEKVARTNTGRDHTIHVTDASESLARLTSLKDKPEQQTTLSATDWLSLLFGAALALNASDIHLEPEQHVLKVRFRIDGVLADYIHITTALQPVIISRIKVFAQLKLNVATEPQDGRLTIYVGSNPVDVRVSTLPSAYGEAVVMRLLGVGAVNLKLIDLGFGSRIQTIVERQLAKPNGMIITTGPTGSGKTTTLYAFLNELNEPGVKIITLEDPVEYKLEGIQQTPIDHRVNFNFASGLRAILRQDPDIVMVGEIRDTETAETALQAALTGHVVFSTLHTNDAAGAIPRLLTMGVKPFVIAPALNAIIAQRLVRRLCPECQQVDTLTPAVEQQVNAILAGLPESIKAELPQPLVFKHAVGCDACHGLGYKGRVGIYEIIEVTDALRTIILDTASTVAMKEQIQKDGFVTMVQDGLLKAAAGITDVAEVFRVAGTN